MKGRKGRRREGNMEHVGGRKKGISSSPTTTTANALSNEKRKGVIVCDDMSFALEK